MVTKNNNTKGSFLRKRGISRITRVVKNGNKCKQLLKCLFKIKFVPDLKAISGSFFKLSCRTIFPVKYTKLVSILLRYSSKLLNNFF